MPPIAVRHPPPNIAQAHSYRARSTIACSVCNGPLHIVERHRRALVLQSPEQPRKRPGGQQAHFIVVENHITHLVAGDDPKYLPNRLGQGRLSLRRNGRFYHCVYQQCLSDCNIALKLTELQGEFTMQADDSLA